MEFSHSSSFEMSFLSFLTLLVSVTFILSQSIVDEQNDEKIVGGYPIEIEEAPYQVSLQVSNKHICGGTLVSEKFVITAAHCVDEKPTLKIRAGSTSQNSGGYLINVDKIYVHPKWRTNFLDYDFAILHLKQEFVFSDKIQPAKLINDTDDIRKAEMAVVSGWGLTGEFEPSIQLDLMAVQVPIIDRKLCEKFYQSRITDRMVCAGFIEGDKDSCSGDSGGPLVRESDSVLVGVVSWGYGCANPMAPGVYSYVKSVRKWIHEITKF